MKVKIYKILFTIICFTLSLNIVNANTIDFSKKGSINISITDKENSKLEGAELSIYHIANAIEKDHNLAFEYIEELKDCPADLTKLDSEKINEEILNCIINKESISSKITNSNGEVSFNNLKLGIYLITQTNKVEGYSSIDSFLVALPELINNKWIYNIKAEPKSEIYKVFDISVKKVWNVSNNENIPESITAGLYKNDVLIDEVILNKDNNWNYTWKEIEKTTLYSVKELNVPKGYSATYTQVDNTFIITNTKTLAFTGQNNLVQVFLSLGLILIITGIIYEKKHNNK